jgi:hypothetical protein
VQDTPTENPAETTEDGTEQPEGAFAQRPDPSNLEGHCFLTASQMLPSS